MRTIDAHPIVNESAHSKKRRQVPFRHSATHRLEQAIPL